MAKRKYRSVPVNSVDRERLLERLDGLPVVVGVDVAKVKQFGALMLPDRSVVQTVRWEQPHEQDDFVRFVMWLMKVSPSVTVGMEPSGVYGDTMRNALLEQGVDVVRVSPKRTHDAAEVYDGVPSRHDAKAAAIVAKLHLDGASEAWPQRSDHERRLHAKLRTLAVYTKEYKRNRDRLESLLSRYWPEVTEELALGSATLLELLKTYGGPQGVAENSVQARRLMKVTGGRFLEPEKVERVLNYARHTVGVPMIEEELELVRVVATECRRHEKLAASVERAIAALVEEDSVTDSMRQMVGRTTAAVLVASVGPPAKYKSAAAYQKSFGLNLRVVHDSGSKKSGLHLSKRGPGIARLFLYMAALRLIQKDEVVKAWYAAKVQRLGGRSKTPAVVAVMRKLALALWHVGRGSRFDATRLFDAQRLGFAGGDLM
jgi:transposase